MAIYFVLYSCKMKHYHSEHRIQEWSFHSFTFFFCLFVFLSLSINLTILLLHFTPLHSLSNLLPLSLHFWPSCFVYFLILFCQPLDFSIQFFTLFSRSTFSLNVFLFMLHLYFFILFLIYFLYFFTNISPLLVLFFLPFHSFYFLLYF